MTIFLLTCLNTEEAGLGDQSLSGTLISLRLVPTEILYVTDIAVNNLKT